MGEDQDAARARGLDEAERGDRLAGAGGVLEPEPPVGVGVVGGFVELDVRVELVALVLPVLGLLVLGLAVVEAVLLGVLVPGDRRGDELGGLGRGGRRPGAVHRPVAVALGLGQERGQRAGQRVDLVGGQHRPVGQVRLLLGEQPLQPEQQRELPPPLDRGLVGPGVELGQGGIERAPARRAGRERVLEGLALVHKLLTGKQLRPRDRGRFREWGGITHTYRKVAL